MDVDSIDRCASGWMRRLGFEARAIVAETHKSSLIVRLPHAALLYEKPIRDSAESFRRDSAPSFTSVPRAKIHRINLPDFLCFRSIRAKSLSHHSASYGSRCQ